MGFQDVSDTPLAALKVYLERLPGLQAELKLILASAASLPHTSQSAAQRILDGWEEQMLADLPTVPRVAPPALLAMMGIRVVPVLASGPGAEAAPAKDDKGKANG